MPTCAAVLLAISPVPAVAAASLVLVLPLLARDQRQFRMATLHPAWILFVLATMFCFFFLFLLPSALLMLCARFAQPLGRPVRSAIAMGVAVAVTASIVGWGGTVAWGQYFRDTHTFRAELADLGPLDEDRLSSYGAEIMKHGASEVYESGNDEAFYLYVEYPEGLSGTGQATPPEELPPVYSVDRCSPREC